MRIKKKITYGIIGCGNIAESHAAAIIKNRSSTLRAVFDIDTARAKNFAARHHCAVAPDMVSLLNNPNIDALTVCTPHDTHKNLILKILASGKYCICEKPLCLTKKDCREIIRVDRSHKVITVFQVRFHTPVQLLLEKVRNGALGKIRFCSLMVRKNRDRHYFSDWHGNRKKAGGMLANHGIHGLDLMLQICGEPVTIHTFSKNIRKYSATEDVFIAHVGFANGAIGNVEVLTCTGNKKPENSIFIAGTRGSMKIGGEVFSRIEYAHLDGNGKAIPLTLASDSAGHMKLIAAANNYILQKKKHPLLPLAVDGLRATSFVEQLYTSEWNKH